MTFTEMQPQPDAVEEPQSSWEPNTSPAPPVLPPPGANGAATTETTATDPSLASPPQPPPPNGQASGHAASQKFTNFFIDNSDGKKERRGKPIHELRTTLLARTGGWPQRVGEMLFARTPGHEVLWLDRPVRLFAWLSTIAQVEWASGPDLIGRETFFEHLKMTCASFDAVETAPHFPSLPGVRYIHPPLPASDGTRFDELLGRFSTATQEDRELLRSFFLTLFWGGKPGKRPVFMFTSSDNDPQGGVGVGKSTVVELASQLVGGFVDVSLGDNFSKVKTRLLSPAARGKRIVRIDNIKQHLDLADLEALITSPIISGHEMFKGEGSRPNTLVWCLTVNAATVTRDFAQRCVIIQLQRPSNHPNWFNETADFIKTYKWQIVADIGHALS